MKENKGATRYKRIAEAAEMDKLEVWDRMPVHVARGHGVVCGAGGCGQRGEVLSEFRVGGWVGDDAMHWLEVHWTHRVGENSMPQSRRE